MSKNRGPNDDGNAIEGMVYGVSFTAVLYVLIFFFGISGFFLWAIFLLYVGLKQL